MKNRYSNCQSCGMPLAKDPQKGGSNKNGSKSTIYCSMCFNEGTFINPDQTVDEMKEIVSSKMKEMGFPGFMAKWYSKKLNKLERWKTQH